jgi:signal transduction histidine kinase
MTHAAGSKARVDIDYSEEFLAVTITNDSTGIDKLKGRKGGGSGVVGMRERTALFGGVFEAGSTDDGGWRVHATFPIGQTRRRGQTGDTE